MEEVRGNERKFRKIVSLTLAGMAMMLVIASTSGMLKVFQRSDDSKENRYLWVGDAVDQKGKRGNRIYPNCDAWFDWPCFGYDHQTQPGYGYPYGYGYYPYYGYYGKGKGRRSVKEVDNFIHREESSDASENDVEK